MAIPTAAVFWWLIKKKTQTQPLSSTEPDKQIVGAPTKSKTGKILAVLACAIIVIVILANSGSNSTSTTSSSSTSSANPSGGSGSSYTPPPAYVPPISKALDEKNGFKDFKFGMTLEEAREILPPSYIIGHPEANETNFMYLATSANRIGDFSVDNVRLHFFEGHLYRIDLFFSNSQNEIFEAFKANFGEPFDTDAWKRDDQPLQAKIWLGSKVSAAILSLPGQPWDSLIIYDIEADKEAHQFKDDAPKRAAKDF